ncbi:MAG: hypothetical protein NTV63_04680 [Candidatus Woesearchaeota archaeon]|nr:hypothetical protein [Candidatus Woesearchaeota archaeon]
MAKAQKLDKTQKEKKKWYEILASKNFNEVSMGETVTASPNSLIGRTISVNLMNITGNIKKQNINVKFRITEIKDNKHALTELIGYEMMPAMIKRIVRRGRDKISDSFIVKTLDGKIVQFKPVFITSGNTSRNVIASLRRAERYFIIKSATEKNYDDIVSEIISGKFQSEMNSFIRKEYPLKVCDIRAFSVLQPTRAVRIEKLRKQDEILSNPEEDEEMEGESEDQRIIENIKKKESDSEKHPEDLPIDIEEEKESSE